MKKIVTLGLALGLVTAVMAKPNVPMDHKTMHAMMAKAAGEAKSPFNKEENFPKEYFLIPKNLPYSIGLTLHHPKSSTLNLSKEQLEKLKKVKADTMPVVIEKAKEIKALELSLVKQLTQEHKKASELDALVDEIAAKKAALTKKHIRCIETVRETLTPEQRKIVKGYVKESMHKEDHKADAK